MSSVRVETDSLGSVEIPADKLWGAQTQRAIEHFAIGSEAMPPEMISAYAIAKRAAAVANHSIGNLPRFPMDLIVQACDEILDGRHSDMFPLRVWMSGSGTPFNMNVNEVIANRCSQLAGAPLGSKRPVHPNDHVNMSQSTNDTFPTAMHIAVARSVSLRLTPSLTALRDAILAKSKDWETIVKVGRTHLQDATPLTLGQEWSGYAFMLTEGLARLQAATEGLFPLTLGGTAVGTGVNAPKGFAERAIEEIARLCSLPFEPAHNKFAAQGSHDAIVQLSGALRGIAVSLTKIANDIRLAACGPRAGIGELTLPANEPGSSIMPGKVNPTQIEAITMVCIQIMSNDVAVGLAGSGGHFEMNAYKPLMIANVMQSIVLIADAAISFRKYLIEGARPNEARIADLVGRSLMLVTALSPVIGYDKAAEIAHHAHRHDMTLKAAALELGHVTEDEFDRHVDASKMTGAGPDSTG